MNEAYKKNKCIFAKNLIYYIDKSGRLQKEIAEDIGVPYTTFNDWCRGRRVPKLQKIRVLADYFGINVGDLIEGQTDQIGCEMGPAKRSLLELVTNCSENDAKDLLSLASIILKK